MFDETHNFRIPDDSFFFHGASSGSYGIGPCTGRSLESVSESESLNSELVLRDVLPSFWYWKSKQMKKKPCLQWRLEPKWWVAREVFNMFCTRVKSTIATLASKNFGESLSLEILLPLSWWLCDDVRGDGKVLHLKITKTKIKSAKQLNGLNVTKNKCYITTYRVSSGTFISTFMSPKVQQLKKK